MIRARQWLLTHLDVLVFGVVLASVGPLMAWWAVLVRRTILRSDALIRDQLQGLPAAEKASELAALDEHTSRQLFMITGESLMAGFLLLVLTGLLFAFARSRRHEARRMETMLQLTTHQLKTPLAGVRTLLQSLGNGAIPAELQPRFLQQGIGECDRLEHMVETTLAYQRTVSRGPGSLESAPAKDLIEEIVEHRRMSFPNEKVSWQGAGTTHVRCDRDAVRVVIENLLDNARKYGGGEVLLQDTLRDGKWMLEVRDQGQGFAPNDGERLFEPFERGGGPGVSHGSGLGLYLSRQLARRMGGDLTAVSSGPGKGSCFTLALRVAPEVRHG